MKSSVNNLSKYFMYFVFTLSALSLTSCSSDDDGDVITEPDPTGTLTVADQTLSGNMLILEDVTVGQDSWVIVRNSNDQQMAADPVLVRDNEDGEVRIQLNENANLTGDTDGDDFDVSLFADNPNQGTMGTFDEGIDQPIRDANNANVTQTVNTTAPSIFADDNQTVTDEGDVTFRNVNTGSTGGFIGLFGQNPDGTPNFDEMVGRSDFIAPGAQTNITARFNEGFNFQAGQTFYPRLFTDNPADEQFTFTSSGGVEDVPETFGFDTTTGEARFVGNSANTATPGGFTVGNTGTGTGAI